MNALALHVEVRVWTRSGSATARPRPAVRPVAAQPHSQQADLAVAKAHNVFREQTHGLAIIDADARGARHILGLIDDDDRKVALLDHRQIGVVVGRGVHHEPVDTRREHRRRTVAEGAVRADRHQQQALARLFARLGEAGNEVQGGRIAERIVRAVR